MPGIAAVIFPDIFQVSNLIDSMTGIMASSAQSKPQVYRYKNIQIGSSGQEICHNKQRTVLAIVDGHLYPNSSLLEKLSKSTAIETKDCSSSELIILLYEKFGIKFLQDLDGEFSFIIYDIKKDELTIARDRIGRKPLYWYHDQHHFLLASEIKSLLASGVISQSLCLNAVASYLFFGYFPQDITPIEGVQKLLPGHFIKFNRKGAKTIKPYWSYSSQFAKENALSREEVTEKLDGFLNDSIKKMSHDSGAYLCPFSSEFLGTATVADRLKKIHPEAKVSTHATLYEKENTEDIKAALSIAKSLKTPLQIDTITPYNILNDFPKLIWHLDEPVADVGIVSTWRLAEYAAQNDLTIFSDIACSELFTEHQRYHPPSPSKISQMIDSLKPWVRKKVIPLIRSVYPPLAFSFLKGISSSSWQAEYLHANALFKVENLLSAAPMLASNFDPEVFLHRFYHSTRIKSHVDTFLYFDVKTRLADSTVFQHEKLSSAHGAKWSSPFLFQNIVELLAGINAKYNSHELLLELSRNSVPDEAHVTAPPPNPNFLKSWADTYALRKIFYLLPQGSLVGNGIISSRWITKQLTSDKIDMNTFKHLWAILVLEVWVRQYIDHPISHQAPELTTDELLLSH
jgi:asparagine synthase (glutamine-hydrolysing)